MEHARPVNEASAELVASWLAAEPEGRFAGNFLPARLRDTFFQYSALTALLEEAALRIAEPTVAAAKLAWWQDELARTQRGGARHPLTVALAACQPMAPFAALGSALVVLQRFESAADERELFAGIAAWAAALSALAAALTGSEPHTWPVTMMQRHVLVRRLRELNAQLRLGRLWLPLDLMAGERLARHQLIGDEGGEALLRGRRAMAIRLLGKREPVATLHPVAAIQDALVELRLEHMAMHGRDELPPLRALWRCWRAARKKA